MNDLLLEIGCEEIPSRFLPGALEQLCEQATHLLKAERLRFNKVETFGTPRRLVLLVRGLAAGQEDLREQVKGPPFNRAYDQEGNPTAALQGFLRSQGVTADKIVVENIKGADYITVIKEIPGRPTVKLLPELLPRLLRQISFPKSMYWHSREVRFARPIRWLLALYGMDSVPFTYAGVAAGRNTYGHRFLAPGPFAVKSAADYFRCLEENHVVLNRQQRREIIHRQVRDAAESCGGRALLDDQLLEEVCDLVEHPVAVEGSFPESYLELPREVLITTMQVHQRYFPVTGRDDEGALLPHFVAVSNTVSNDNVRRGYEKVLQARLADARFFFDEDSRVPLEAYVERLPGVIFQETLGSLDDKRQRLLELVHGFAEILGLDPRQRERAARAAHLCKADLVTLMVKEFPELQGIMGREYAILSGEHETVARAIFEHYLPRHGGDAVPETMEGALVSLADRIDTLVGCFAVGIQPTGSQDPYGLRRHAQAIISILLAQKLELPLDKMVALSLETLKEKVGLSIPERTELQDSLREFFKQRIRFVFQEKGLSYDVVEAVLAVPFTAPGELFERAEALEKNLRGPVMSDIIVAYQRVANLSRKATAGAVEPSLFSEEAEEKLYRALEKTGIKLEQAKQQGLYDVCLTLLQSLRRPVDQFFDDVLVMTDDESVRENRLHLLLAVKNLFNLVADFSLLQSIDV